MKRSKDLTEINSALSPVPPLLDQWEVADEAHEVKEDRLLSQFEKLKGLGMGRPLCYFFSKNGLYARFYFSNVEQEFSLYIPTQNSRALFKKLQENLSHA